MTKAERQEQLEGLLLGLLPANGSTVSNGQLLNLWTQAAKEAGLTASDDDFAALREDLVARGLVVKGKGRGGSTARASAAALGSEAFTLEGQAAVAAEEVGAAGKAPRAKAGGKPKLRAANAGEEAQVLSYRHADRRKNNPEVGLVSEASDPQQPKKEWAYNPHLDPVLNFDSARAELESLIDEALAVGEGQPEEYQKELLSFVDLAISSKDEAGMRDVLRLFRQALVGKAHVPPERQALQ
jgi:adenine-specific DNA-methyltransferase